MEKYHYLKMKTPHSVDSMLPIEITDDMYAMNFAFVERYGIENLPEDWKTSQGIYILFSHLKPGQDFEAYVGQTVNSFHKRLNRHNKERDFWDVAILARRTTPEGLNSLHLNSIEGQLRDILEASPNVHVHNGYPTGDKTLQASDANLVDEISLSIMRAIFIRGYRTQAMYTDENKYNENITPIRRIDTATLSDSLVDIVPNDTNDTNADIKAMAVVPDSLDVKDNVDGLAIASGYIAPIVTNVDSDVVANKLERLKAWRKDQAVI